MAAAAAPSAPASLDDEKVDPDALARAVGGLSLVQKNRDMAVKWALYERQIDPASVLTLVFKEGEKIIKSVMVPELATRESQMIEKNRKTMSALPPDHDDKTIVIYRNDKGVGSLEAFEFIVDYMMSHPPGPNGDPTVHKLCWKPLISADWRIIMNEVCTWCQEHIGNLYFQEPYAPLCPRRIWRLITAAEYMEMVNLVEHALAFAATWQKSRPPIPDECMDEDESEFHKNLHAELMAKRRGVPDAELNSLIKKTNESGSAYMVPNPQLSDDEDADAEDDDFELAPAAAPAAAAPAAASSSASASANSSSSSVFPPSGPIGRSARSALA